MLTDKQLKTLTGGEKVYKVADQQGLYAAVLRSGNISFRYDYRVNGRRETLVIQRGDGSLERLAYASPWSYPGGEITYGTGDHTNELVTLAV